MPFFGHKAFLENQIQQSTQYLISIGKKSVKHTQQTSGIKKHLRGDPEVTHSFVPSILEKLEK
jgi:hypothetical protein